MQHVMTLQPNANKLTKVLSSSHSWCAGFASDQCPEGFVSVAKSTLRILTLERLGETFNQQTAVLRYTPRKFVIHPDHRVIIVAEADHGAVPLAQREDLPGPMNIENGAIQEPGFRVCFRCLCDSQCDLPAKSRLQR